MQCKYFVVRFSRRLQWLVKVDPELHGNVWRKLRAALPRDNFAMIHVDDEADPMLAEHFDQLFEFTSAGLVEVAQNSPNR